MSSWYILDINSLPDVELANIFFNSVGYLKQGLLPSTIHLIKSNLKEKAKDDKLGERTCIHQLSITLKKYIRQLTYKEKSAVVLQGSRHYNPRSKGLIASGSMLEAIIE